MKKILWKLLKLVDSNWGFTTPIQERFKVGDKCNISIFYIKNEFSELNTGEEVTIIETARYDYLVEKNLGKKSIVYQFELV